MADTWDPSFKGSSLALSNGNLTVTSSAGGTWTGLLGTTTLSGKVYFEVTCTTVNRWFSVGVGNHSAPLNASFQNSVNCAGWINGSFFGSNSQTYRNASTNGTWPLLSNGVVMRVAVDVGSSLIWFAQNNNTWTGSTIWQGTGSGTEDPASGNSGFSLTGVSGPLFPMFTSNLSGDVNTINTTGPFTYAVPSGFTAAGATTAAQARVMMLA